MRKWNADVGQISPKPAGPGLNLAHPWAANPKPRINLRKRFGQACALARFWNFNMLLALQCRSVSQPAIRPPVPRRELPAGCKSQVDNDISLRTGTTS